MDVESSMAEMSAHSDEAVKEALFKAAFEQRPKKNDRVSHTQNKNLSWISAATLTKYV